MLEKISGYTRYIKSYGAKVEQSSLNKLAKIDTRQLGKKKKKKNYENDGIAFLGHKRKHTISSSFFLKDSLK